MKPDYSTLTLSLFAAGTIGLNTQTIIHSGTNDDFSPWFSLLEIPFLLAAARLSFIVVSAHRGGEFGKGMSLIAPVFLIMAIGHMQMEHLTGFITSTKPTVYKL